MKNNKKIQLPPLFEAFANWDVHAYSPYDGIKGVLPRWVLPHFQQEFCMLRDSLLHNHNHADLLRYLAEVRWILNGQGLLAMDEWGFGNILGGRRIQGFLRVAAAIDKGIKGIFFVPASSETDAEIALFLPSDYMPGDDNDRRTLVKAPVTADPPKLNEDEYVEGEYYAYRAIQCPHEILFDVCRLSQFQEAVRLGREEGMLLLTDKRLAGFSRGGRGPGPIRKWIARQLKKNPTMKNRELWTEFARNPLRDWQVMENRQGKYLEGPKGNDHMTYGRFSNVCKEVRDNMKG